MDLSGETRTTVLNHQVDEDEDFGYVRRGSDVLVKALTSPDNNRAAGSDINRIATDVEASGDGARRSSVDDEHPNSEDVKDRKKGILKSSNQEVEDSKLRSTSVASSNSVDSDRKSSKKQSGMVKKMSVTKSIQAGPAKVDLPQSFQVKYLGHRDARGLWGIKHTRRPVDAMVSAAKTLRVGTVLPIVKLTVTTSGVQIQPINAQKDDAKTFYSIDTISYGVQDLVYTRVFCMIIVKDSGGNQDVHPFECHAFVCDSRNGARRLTYSLATAFQEYSKAVNSGGASSKEKVAQIKKRFAIDLRSPDEIEADLGEETEA